MKRSNEYWVQYLQEGISYMEGLTPNGRSFSRAAIVFEECAEQMDNLTVKAEAHFRRAQTAHYQKQFDTARQWVNDGKRWLYVSTGATKRAQCLLIEGIVLEDERHFAEAMTLYGQIWEMAVGDQKLQGDIANRMARLTSAHINNATTQEACEWISRAEKCFSSIDQPDESVYHALASARSMAGYILRRRSNELWREAEELFAEGRVHDPFIRAAHWFNRHTASVCSLQPIRAIWFFIRFLCCYMKCKSE